MKLSDGKKIQEGLPWKDGQEMPCKDVGMHSACCHVLQELSLLRAVAEAAEKYITTSNYVDNWKDLKQALSQLPPQIWEGEEIEGLI